MDGNLYFECRKEAATVNDKLKSRAGAAEILGVSESSLTHYELGITKSVPVDVVVMMAELYNAPQLKYLYCKQECPIGKFIPMATQEQPLEIAALHLLDSLDPHKIEEYSRRIIKIAADGSISAEEQKELELIMEALEQASKAISELGILVEKHKNGKERAHGTD